LATDRAKIWTGRTQTENFAVKHEGFLDEYAQWDRLVASIGNESDEPDLSSNQRAAAVEAVGFFRRRFGDGWLRAVFDQAHPFMDLVWNRAPWTRVRMADIAQAMHEVESLPGGERLINRYARSDQQSGAIFELDLAATALRKGLVVVLEPATQPGRKCDLSVAEPVRRDANTVFIEVQAVQAFGKDTERAMEAAERLAPRMAGAMARCELLGEIYRVPSDAEMAELVPVTNAFWKQCESATEPLHLVLEDVMDVWAVPFEHRAKEGLIASGVPNGFRSPAPDDPVRRTFRAIRQKIGQLPTLAPGLVVLRPPRLLLPSLNYMPNVISAVKQAIAASPQVSAVAIVDWAYRSTATPNEARVSIAGALVVHHVDRSIFVREIVLVKNPSRVYTSADRVIDRLFE
jgi:hypothetical protein